MKLNLISTYSLYITISSELIDVSIQLLQNEVKTMQIIMFLLTTYYLNILNMLKILMLGRKTRT